MTVEMQHCLAMITCILLVPVAQWKIVDVRVAWKKLVEDVLEQKISTEGADEWIHYHPQFFLQVVRLRSREDCTHDNPRLQLLVPWQSTSAAV